VVVAPIVIAHRGASGYRPEHTLAAYQVAIRQGADYIEPDLVSTKDRVLVARHENEISGTTDVADHPEFASRRTTKTIDGNAVTGWFTEDFTLAELKTLRAKERLPQLRPANTAYDGRFQVPTLQEVIDLVERESKRRHRTIGIAPETKHPTYFDAIGLSLEEPLIATLKRNHLDRRSSKVVVQSFEVGNLQEVNRKLPVQIALNIDASGAPYDFRVKGDPRTYDDLVTPEGLRFVASFADWASVEKSRIIPRDATGRLLAPTTLVRDAHRARLKVVSWTFRTENNFLPLDFRIGIDPAAHGDGVGEMQLFLKQGLDALFTDFPDLGVAARDGLRSGSAAE
jgi:glycerophosphoryl diester phosphodiesterase